MADAKQQTPSAPAALANQPKAATTEVLKAVSHPLRRKILRTLERMGHARATELAEELGVSVGSVSFHLHTLGSARLIEEAPKYARDRRDRVWKPTGRSLSFGAPGTPEEDEALTLAVVATEFEDHQALVERLTRNVPDIMTSDDERIHGTMMNMRLRASHDRMEKLLDEVTSLVQEARGEVDEDDRETPFWELSLVAVDEHLPDADESAAQHAPRRT